MPVPSKTKPITVVSSCCLALALGGCQMLNLTGHTASVGTRELQTELPDDFGARQLAEGRKALVEGRTADAIDSFMLAKTFPDHAAAAFNGLAVAYSRIGRLDLTERFFQTAIALAPSEERYQTNLALFYSRNPVDRETAPALAVAIAVASPPVPDVTPSTTAPAVRALRAGLSVRNPASHLQRVSQAEVRIATGAPPSAGVPSRGGHRAVIAVGEHAVAEYPVRITLADVPPRRASGYPIRIELDH